MWTYTVHTGGATSRQYTGFKDFVWNKVDLQLAMYVVIAQEEDSYTIWMCEDEQGFRNLQRFYRDLELPDDDEEETVFLSILAREFDPEGRQLSNLKLHKGKKTEVIT